MNIFDKRCMIMKQLKISIFFMLIITVLLMTGCDQPSITDKDETSLETVSPAVEIQISVDRATDELLSSYASFHEFVDSSGFGRVLLIKPNVTIRDFNFLEIQISDDGIEYNILRKLYSLDELTPEKPFVLSGILGAGTLNIRGISFTDTHDAVRYFYIRESGYDGSIITGEFYIGNG